MAQQLAPLRIYDLLYLAHHSPGHPCVGREAVFERLARTLQRHDVRHAAIVGKAGAGKTALIGSFATALLERRYKGLRAVPLLQLDTSHLMQRLTRSSSPAALIAHFEQALLALPPCVLVIDEADELLTALPEAGSVGRIMAALTGMGSSQTLFMFDEETWPQRREVAGAWLAKVETITLDELGTETCRGIVQERARYIAGRHRVQLQSDVPNMVVDCAEQLPGQAQPDRSLQLLHEVCAAAALQQEPVVTTAHVQTIFSQRTGQSAAVINGASPERLRTLRATLHRGVIGQAHVVDTVASVIERGWLGLKNPQRPLGSFLFFGPSGVGKTEIARVIAQEVYGSPAAFVRIDMSEYAQAHTVQRLLGAPPGYVGYEAGGQLTSAVLKQPFSLILLDEIEKADPAVFDIFLQILEDGRLTDGQGTTVDFRKTIIIATSNVGVETIIEGWRRNEPVTDPAWRAAHLMPKLATRFRLEFLNRWEAMAVFSPLSEEALFDIAQLELQKMTARLQRHKVRIRMSPDVLRTKIQSLSDPRFGARPLKRWLENEVEAQLAQRLLAR